MTTVFALLPPLPLAPRLVFGYLGMLFAGILNVWFRAANWRWRGFVVALFVTPSLIIATWVLDFKSGQRTEYVFLGAIAAIVCIRGAKSAGEIPFFAGRVTIVMLAFAILGPAIGLLVHYLRYLAGLVHLHDDWEIQLSLEDGASAAICGELLAVIMVLASSGLFNYRKSATQSRW